MLHNILLWSIWIILLYLAVLGAGFVTWRIYRQVLYEGDRRSRLLAYRLEGGQRVRFTCERCHYINELQE